MIALRKQLQQERITTMSEEKHSFEEMALELLNFLEIFEKGAPDMYPYRLVRARTFLEMKFGHVEALQKEVEALRKWKETTMPVMVKWSEMHTPQNHPLDFDEEG
jgi:hypothetical protein